MGVNCGSQHDAEAEYPKAVLRCMLDLSLLSIFVHFLIDMMIDAEYNRRSKTKALLIIEYSAMMVVVINLRKIQSPFGYHPAFWSKIFTSN